MTQLFITILNWVQSFVGNYGWSVIVFTLLIKLCLLPLDYKSRRSMRAMSLLNPKLEELKKRYANDQEKLNKKTQELYKKNGVNPLSGCLPMLIQLPILYIMFAAMRRVAAQMQIEIIYKWAVENGLALVNEDGVFTGLAGVESVQNVLDAIRNGTASFGDTQSWLWIKSIFQPDNFSRMLLPSLSELATTYGQYEGKLALDENHINFITQYLDYVSRSQYGANADLANAVTLALQQSANFKSASMLGLFSISIPTTWTGYINGLSILPVLACVTQLLSTKLQPAQPAANNQQGGTGKFMKWFFPVFSLWICWSSTASFAIYWVFVNVWGIVSTFAINFFIEKKDKDTAEGGSDNSTNKEALQP
ncbi:MAG: membrane protein insertase YidC [Clostridia bacterium]|nr:membrane protein insertase YidC [Clostridia bacterium]